MTMDDQFIENLKKNEELLSRLTDGQVMSLALSELMAEMAVGKDVPLGLDGISSCSNSSQNYLCFGHWFLFRQRVSLEH